MVDSYKDFGFTDKLFNNIFVNRKTTLLVEGVKPAMQTFPNLSVEFYPKSAWANRYCLVQCIMKTYISSKF